MKKTGAKRYSHGMVLAAIVTMGSGKPALAKQPIDAREGSASIIVSIYDYAHEKRSELLAAEGEATRILAQAGINANWVDCPTSLGETDNYPNCRPPWPANHYVLKVVPEAMAALSGKSEDVMGSALDCSVGPYCTASVFYDRVMNLVGGSTATASVLRGRVMAHEIGHLLLGAHSHSRAGVMQAFWSARELRPNAGRDMCFTEEQSRQMKARFTEGMQTLRAKADGLGSDR